MKHWNESMANLNNMIVEMIKSTRRILEITVELIKGEELNKELLGEGFYIEEDLNHFQVTIDEKVVETLARYQPTAIDLRAVISIMKINTDLERIGDHCVNINKTIRRAFNDKKDLNHQLVDIAEMGDKVINMYELFQSGYLNQKVENAYIILGLDDEIDQLKEEHIHHIKDEISANVECLDLGIENLLISRNYERIADQITNLAESLIYIYKGEDLRHKKIYANKEQDNK